MNCKDAHKEFLTLLDGDLGLTERAPLEVHLDECRECWSELERLQKKSALPRAIWRARLALGNLGLLEALTKTISRLPRRVFSRVPSGVFLVAATVALMMVLVTYGFQGRSELGTELDHGAPEASPGRKDSPQPTTPPGAALASQSEAPSISRLPEAAAPVRARTEIPRARPRQGAIPGRRVVAVDPVRPTAEEKPQAGPSAIWLMGHTRDEQIVPETTAVRQDRD
jgi:hypothetical protein